MSRTIVSPSLIAKTKPIKNYREENFHLGILGWCPCSDCTSFSLDSIPHLQDSFEQTRDQSINSIIHSLFNIDVDIDEVETEAKKENIGDCFSFDTTSDELEKLMEGECLVSTAKNNGVLLEISNFLK